MATLQELAIEPGIVASGTERQSKGYWRASNLMRWSPTLQPVGGWRAKSTSAASGKARAIIVWRDHTPSRWAGIGTHTKLYIMSAAGTLYDVTPSALTTGAADATNSAGYGAGVYGAGTYGDPILDTGTIVPASVWTLDTFGQYLVGCFEPDGRIVQWELNTGTPAAAITGAPTGKSAIVTTAESTIFALDDRNVAWCNRGDQTDWTPSATNEAGDYDLETVGTLRCGVRVRGQTLLLTDADVWAATYRRDVFVYNFEKVGAEGTGIVAKGAAVPLEGGAAWWGRGAFFSYNGGQAEPIPCPVYDEVFADVNLTQISKVSAWHNARHGEVWWHYPSAASTENDKAVAWNYRSGKWTLHTLARLAGASSAGVFEYPHLTASDGTVYEHEVGSDWDDATPYVRSGPIELGSGDQVFTIDSFIGDEAVMGDAQIRVFTRDYPGLTETEHGPFALSSQPSFCRVTARQMEVQVEVVGDAQARVGALRYSATARGRR